MRLMLPLRIPKINRHRVNKFVLREVQIVRASNSSFAKCVYRSRGRAKSRCVSHFLKYLLHSTMAAAISQSRFAEIMRVAIFCSQNSADLPILFQIGNYKSDSSQKYGEIKLTMHFVSYRCSYMRHSF